MLDCLGQELAQCGEEWWAVTRKNEIHGWHRNIPASGESYSVWDRCGRGYQHQVVADAEGFEVRADEGSGYNSISTTINLPTEMVITILEGLGYVVTKA